MEKKSLLDACCKIAGVTIIILAVAASCSLPRIVLLHDPLTPEEHINLGVAYEKRGELDAALKEYKAAAKKMPLANLYVGNIHFQQKRFEDAEKSYKKAIKATQSADAYNNLAWLYFTTDAQLDEAEQLAQKAVELAPQSEAFRDTLRKIREKKCPVASTNP